MEAIEKHKTYFEKFKNEVTGQFEKGNPGKRKGTINKISVEQKKRVEWVLCLLEETLEESIAKLKPKDRVELWLNLQEYIRPKLQRMNVDLSPPENKLTKITFEVINSAIPHEGIDKSLTGREDVKESTIFRKN